MSDETKLLKYDADAAPDVTIKLTDDQLSDAGKEARHQAAMKAPSATSATALKSTIHLGATVFGDIANFVQTVILPDRKPQEDDTISSTRNSSTTSCAADTPAVSITPPDDSELPSLPENYLLGRRFASGGQGILSIAQDKVLRRLVALKSLRPELLDKNVIREAFVTEALITAQLEHPAIVPVYSLLHDDKNGIHLAMKMVRGTNLNDRIEALVTSFKPGSVTKWAFLNRLKSRVEIFLRICDPIAYAHSKGIIHCDLKPENIMLGDYGEVYVMDWGIARAIRDADGKPIAAPPPKSLDGTPRFIPQEAYFGKLRDERADIYALGLILYEMVTLQHGYDGHDIKSVITLVKEGRRNPVAHRFGLPIPKDLAAIIEKATAYDPEDRYPTVNALCEDCKRFLLGEAVSARPENWLGRSLRMLRRYSRTFIALTLIGWLIVLIFSVHALKGKVGDAYKRLFSQKEQFDQLRDSARAERYQRKLEELDANVVRSAMRLSNQLVQMQGTLKHLALVAGYLHDTPNPHQDQDMLPIRPWQEIRNNPYRPADGQELFPEAPLVDPRCCSWQAPKAANPKRVQQELEIFSALSRPLSYLVFSSAGTPDTAVLPSTENLNRLISSGFVIRRAYIGLDDTGLQIAYPANGGYKENFDNHTRPWYKAARKAFDNPWLTRPVWGEAYDDVYTGKVITCSTPVVDKKGEFRGVIAFDLYFNKLRDDLATQGNGMSAFIIAKYLLDEHGKPLCRIHNPMAANLDDRPARARLIHQIQNQQNGYGHVTMNVGGSEVIFHYAHIPVLNLYIVELSSKDGIIARLRATDQKPKPLP